MSASREALIVGGSLSGLLSGIVLKRAGWHVRVFERSASMEAQGAGIVFGSDTQHYFRMFDLSRTALDVKSEGGRQYLRRDGSVMDGEDHVQRMTSWDKLFYVLRANFDGYVRDGYLDRPAPPEEGTVKAEYQIGHAVTAYDFDPAQGKVVIKYTTADDAAREQVTTSDLVICAEGASSDWRKAHLPDVKRTYAGYLAIRGLVPEEQLPPDVKDALLEKFTFFHSKGIQFLCYLIPGAGGTLARRRMNFVWYITAEEGTEEHKNIMTDREGRQHPFTMRPGDLTPETLKWISDLADKRLPQSLAKLWHLCDKPFCQAITDVRTTCAVFPASRVALNGDAVCGVRPHTAASTSQAAYHAMLLWNIVKDGGGAEDVIKAMDGEWQQRVMRRAKELEHVGKSLGERSQFGDHPLQDNSGL